MTQDLDKMCRTCAGVSTSLMPIFGNDGLEKQLGEKINKHLPIQVMESDLLPTKMCSRCIFSLEASIEFHKICEKADDTLKVIVAEQHPDVLTEVPDEDVTYDNTGMSEKDLDEADDSQWVQEETSVPYCETCNILFSNPKDLVFHNQETHRSQASIIIPPPSIDPISETVFYNEVEITKKKRLINRPPITKIIPKGATTLSNHALTLLKPTAAKMNRTSAPLLIKSSPVPKSALEKIMTSQPLRVTPRSMNSKKLNIPCVPINLGSEQAGSLQDMANKPIIIPSYEGRAEDAMDVEVFVPETPLFDLDNVAENVPIHVNIPSEMNFSCDNCQKGFKSKALLKDHIVRKYIVTNPEDFEYICDECGKKFPTSYSLKAHIRNKRARNIRITCEICNEKVTKKEWNNHFGKHNNDDKFNCLICNKKFVNNAHLNQHSSVHANLKFECDLCSATFNRKSNLMNHRKIHLASAELAENLRCDICNYQSNDRYYMMHHHKVHFSTELSSYVCPITTCDFSSTEFQSLRDHCAAHPREELNLYTKRRKRAQRVAKNLIPPYLCSLCKSEFNRPVEYSSHISQDHGVELMAGEAIFTCNHCLECYGSLLDLNEHLEKHPEAHKYPCTKCNMTFAVFNNRNHHLSTVHSTKFECEICNMSFMTVFKLKEHMPSHSDIKPFICTTCGKGFKRKRTLGEHQKVHSDIKKFVCEHCNARFRWKGDLVRHATRHTGINLYHCSECEFSSNKRKEVEAHISENHSVIVDMQV